MSRTGDRLDKRLKEWILFSKDQAFWTLVARLSASDRWEKEIGAGCKLFGLDPGNQAHRDILLGILAEIHFRPLPINNALSLHPSKPSGRKVKWDKS